MKLLLKTTALAAIAPTLLSATPVNKNAQEEVTNRVAISFLRDLCCRIPPTERPSLQRNGIECVCEQIQAKEGSSQTKGAVSVAAAFALIVAAFAAVFIF